MHPRKRTSPIFWVAIGGLAIAAFVLTTPPEATAPTRSKVATKKAATKANAGPFTEADTRAKFTPVNDPLKNAFRPVVAQRSASIGFSSGPMNAVPAEFAGGEGSWIYTGSAEIDGVPVALIENRSTNDGVFLKAGERWKSLVVRRITPNSVVLLGPSGTVTLTPVDDQATGGGAPAPLQGQIQGSGFAPAPVAPPQGLTAVPETSPSAVIPNNNDNERRRRRGGGFGGGNRGGTSNNPAPATIGGDDDE
jgi:hypothetical protein